MVYPDTLDYCLNFSKQKNTCGAIGVKMVNAHGDFLAESKRSFHCQEIHSRFCQPSCTSQQLRCQDIQKPFPLGEEISLANPPCLEDLMQSLQK